jgi:hypothetical protein
VSSKLNRINYFLQHCVNVFEKHLYDQYLSPILEIYDNLLTDGCRHFVHLINFLFPFLWGRWLCSGNWERQRNNDYRDDDE